MATSTAIDTGTESSPRTRAAGFALSSWSPVHASVTTMQASASRTLHVPASSPAIAPAAAARQAANATTDRITPESVKNPRFTSPQSGVHHRKARDPATVSASTSAITPAEPLTRAASA